MKTDKRKKGNTDGILANAVAFAALKVFQQALKANMQPAPEPTNITVDIPYEDVTEQKRIDK